MIEQVGLPLPDFACFLLLSSLIHPWLYSDVQQKCIEDLFVPGSVLEVNPASLYWQVGGWRLCSVLAATTSGGHSVAFCCFFIVVWQVSAWGFSLITYRVEFNALRIWMIIVNGLLDVSVILVNCMYFFQKLVYFWARFLFFLFLNPTTSLWSTPTPRMAGARALPTQLPVTLPCVELDILNKAKQTRRGSSKFPTDRRTFSGFLWKALVQGHSCGVSPHAAGLFIPIKMQPTWTLKGVA